MTECTSMQTNWNPNFQIYSVIKNLKRKDFNFLTKSYRFFIITHEKVKKFQVLRKCPLVIFGSSGKLSKTTKKDFWKFSTKKIFLWLGKISAKKDTGKWSTKIIFPWWVKLSTRNISTERIFSWSSFSMIRRVFLKPKIFPSLQY